MQAFSLTRCAAAVVLCFATCASALAAPDARIADKFKALGAEVELIEPGSPASPEVYRMEDTPEKIGKMMKATFKGSGTKNAKS